MFQGSEPLAVPAWSAAALGGWLAWLLHAPAAVRVSVISPTLSPTMLSHTEEGPRQTAGSKHLQAGLGAPAAGAQQNTQQQCQPWLVAECIPHKGTQKQCCCHRHASSQCVSLKQCSY